MDRKEIINKVAEKTRFTKKDISTVVTALWRTVGDVLQSGEQVRFVNFGTFITVERAARRTTNPYTGTLIVIPPKTRVKFKPGKSLREKCQ